MSGEEKARGDLTNVQKYLMEPEKGTVKKRKSDSSQWYPTTGQDAMGAN